MDEVAEEMYSESIYMSCKFLTQMNIVQYQLHTQMVSHSWMSSDTSHAKRYLPAIKFN